MTMKDYLSKRVLDSYGRTLGKVIACTRTGDGEDLLLGIELLGGGFLTSISSQLEQEGDGLVFDETWRTKSEIVSRELSVAVRKVSALNRLYSQGEVSKETYDVLSSEYEDAVAAHTKRKEMLQKQVEERSRSLFNQTREMENYIVNLKIGHELGEVDDETYVLSRDSLSKVLNQLQAEQKDLDAALANLFEHFAPAERQIEKKATTTISKPLQDLPILVKIKEANPGTEG